MPLSQNLIHGEKFLSTLGLPIQPGARRPRHPSLSASHNPKHISTSGHDSVTARCRGLLPSLLCALCVTDPAKRSVSKKRPLFSSWLIVFGTRVPKKQLNRETSTTIVQLAALLHSALVRPALATTVTAAPSASAAPTAAPALAPTFSAGGENENLEVDAVSYGLVGVGVACFAIIVVVLTYLRARRSGAKKLGNTALSQKLRIRGPLESARCAFALFRNASARVAIETRKTSISLRPLEDLFPLSLLKKECSIFSTQWRGGFLFKPGDVECRTDVECTVSTRVEPVAVTPLRGIDDDGGGDERHADDKTAMLPTVGTPRDDKRDIEMVLLPLDECPPDPDHIGVAFASLETAAIPVQDDVENSAPGFLCCGIR